MELVLDRSEILHPLLRVRVRVRVRRVRVRRDRLSRVTATRLGISVKEVTGCNPFHM